MTNAAIVGQMITRVRPAQVIQGKIPALKEFGDGFVTHSTDAQNPELATPSSSRSCEVHRADLPLSCPTPEQHLWNAHPRVYLPIEKTGEATCPYCGTHYRLVD